MTIRSALRAALTALVVLPLSLHANDTAAQKKSSKAKPAASAPAPAKKTSIALGAVSGAKPNEVRGWVADALKQDFEVTDAEDFQAKGTNATFVKMTKDLGVEAIVFGKIEQRRLVISVRGKDGKARKDIVLNAVRGPKLKQAISSQLNNDVRSALGIAKPKPPPPPVEEEEEEEEEELDEGADADEDAADADEDLDDSDSQDEEPAGPLGATASPLVLMGGVRFTQRSLTFNDTLTQLQPGVPLANPAYAMRDYKLQLGPAVFAKVELYPGVFLGGDGFMTNVGLIGGFEFGLRVASRYAGNVMDVPPELTNSTQDWYFGARMRFPSATSEFGARAAYGQHRFILEGDELFPIVPDVSYSYLKLAGDAWLHFGSLFVGAELGVRVVLGTGALEEVWFPNAAGNAIDAGVRLGYSLSKSLSIVIGGDIVRYGLDFNPINKAEAQRVAGGAIDQYLSGFAAIRFAFSGREASGDVEGSMDAEVELDLDEEEDVELEED